MQELIGDQLPEVEVRSTEVMQSSELVEINTSTQEKDRRNIDKEVDDDQIASHWRCPASPG